MAATLVSNNEWFVTPTDYARNCSMLRIHRFGFIDPATAHLTLPNDFYEEYMDEVKRRVEGGTLRSVQTGTPVIPLQGKGWFKSSGNRKNHLFCIDQEGEGHQFELVDYFYQKY
jgi:hypothetical protein